MLLIGGAQQAHHWSKGINASIISINGITINDSKYSNDISSKDRTSTLTIMSQDENDVNVPYTCQYGFNTYKQVLNMTVED